MTVTASVELNQADHTYTINGRRAPGTTSIIKEAGFADWRFVDEFYRDRGSRAHQAIYLAFVGRLLSCPDDCEGYVISAANFIAAHNGRTIATERRVFSLPMWYAGTLDWIGPLDSCDDSRCCPVKFRDALSLLDWKSSKVFHPATAIQTVSYALAYFEETKQLVKRRMCVLVDIDGGTAKKQEYPAKQLQIDIDAWRAALVCHAWRRENRVTSVYLDKSVE